MKILILLSGASGAGKSTMIDEIIEYCQDLFIGMPKIALNSKITNRDVRPGEVGKKNVDNVGGCDKEDVTSCEYVYEWEGHFYGIRKAKLDATLANNDMVLMTVKDYETAQKLIEDYSGEVRVIRLVLDPVASIEKRLQQRTGCTTNERDERVRGLQEEKEAIARIENEDRLRFVPVDDVESGSLIKAVLAIPLGVSSAESFIATIERLSDRNPANAITKYQLRVLKDIKDPRMLGVILGRLRHIVEEGSASDLDSLTLRLQAGDAVAGNIDRFYDMFNSPLEERIHASFKESWVAMRKRISMRIESLQHQQPKAVTLGLQ